MRKIIVCLILCFTVGIFSGCAKYQSKSPVQEQNMLPTRYQTNIDHNNTLYNNNANFISSKNPANGVRTEKQIARRIVKIYPQVEAASVVIIKNRAYVAVSLKKQGSTLGHLRVEIPALVKDMDAVVEKVYVSDNPNFRKMVEKKAKK